MRFITKLIVALLAVSIQIKQSTAQTWLLDNGFNTFDNGVSSAGAGNSILSTAVQSDGKILIGGAFQFYHGIAKNRILRINADGTIDNTFNTSGSGANNDVRTILIQPDGKIILAGAFTSYNGTSTSNIVRLTTNGTIDPTFSATVTGGINCMALQSDGKIVIAGDFANANGFSVNRVFRLNSDGSSDLSFTPVGAGNTINDVLIQSDGKIILAGAFQFFNGNAHNGIVRINASGSDDNTFNHGTAFAGTVYSIKFDASENIYAGGAFTSYNGTPRTNLAYINNNGTLNTTFNPSLNGTVFQVQYNPLSSKLMIAGGFTNPVNGKRIMRLDWNGTIDNTFNAPTGANNNVFEIQELTDGTYLLAGQFTNYEGVSVGRIVKCKSNGNYDPLFNLTRGADSDVKIIKETPDGKLIVGGSFGRYNTNNSNQIMRINADGTYDSSFIVGSGIAGQIEDVKVQTDGKVVVSGYFTSYNDTVVKHIFRLNTNGSIDNSFTPPVFNSTIYTIEIQADGKILCGGVFSTVGGNARNYMARLNSDGTFDSGFMSSGSGFNNEVFDIAVASDGKIYVGGSFELFNGSTARKLIRLNSDGTVDTNFPGNAFPAGSTTYVKKIILDETNNRLTIAGEVFLYYSLSFNRLLRINLSNNGGDASFVTNMNSGVGGLIRDVVLLGNQQLMIAGDFTTVGGQTYSHLALINESGTIDVGFTLGANANVLGLGLQNDGKVVLGGQFTQIANTGKFRIGRIKSCSATAAAINITSCGNYSLNNITYSASGTYTQTITNADGCDSIITLNLAINPTYAASQTISLCSGESYTINGNTYTNSGIYYDTLATITGCDSIITTTINAFTFDTTISLTASYLVSNQPAGSGASYEWLVCNGDGTYTTTNESQQYYLPTSSGSYAVVVYNSSCADTSACFAYTTIGLKDNYQHDITVYPNPSNGSFLIQGENISLITVADLLGKQVSAIKNPENKTTITISQSGVYILHIISGGKTINHKIIVQ